MNSLHGRRGKKLRGFLSLQLLLA